MWVILVSSPNLSENLELNPGSDTEKWTEGELYQVLI